MCGYISVNEFHQRVYIATHFLFHNKRAYNIMINVTPTPSDIPSEISINQIIEDIKPIIPDLKNGEHISFHLPESFTQELYREASTISPFFGQILQADTHRRNNIATHNNANASINVEPSYKMAANLSVAHDFFYEKFSTDEVIAEIKESFSQAVAYGQEFSAIHGNGTVHPLGADKVATVTAMSEFTPQSFVQMLHDASISLNNIPHPVSIYVNEETEHLLGTWNDMFSPHLDTFITFQHSPTPPTATLDYHTPPVYLPTKDMPQFNIVVNSQMNRVSSGDVFMVIGDITRCFDYELPSQLVVRAYKDEFSFVRLEPCVTLKVEIAVSQTLHQPEAVICFKVAQ